MSRKLGEVVRFFEETVLHYTGDDCLVWPFSRDSSGYAHIWYRGKQRKVCRLVCESVHGAPRASDEAAHSCGNGASGCVTPNHLRWATRRENEADKKFHGILFATRGETHGMARLTEADVLKIRSMAGTVKQSAIAAAFKISPSYVSDIQRGRRWGWL